MSACNGFVTTTAAHLFTDAAVFDPKTFQVLAFMNKVCHLPQLGAAVSATGNAMVPALFGSAMAECNLNDFDEMIRESPDILLRYKRKLEQAGQGHFFDDFRITIAGWSPAANAPALYCFQGDDKCIGAGAFEMFPADHSINPAAADTADRSIIDIKFDPAEPARSGLEIMRAQRERKFGLAADHGIGGWCQMTTVTRDSITTKVLERWPDKVGLRIDPTIARQQPGFSGRLQSTVSRALSGARYA